MGTLLSGVAGDHRRSSFSSTIAANPGSRESLVGFGRCARDHAARSATTPPDNPRARRYP
ncbi:MAG: hypothetical protein ACRDSR_21255 [Pseudonocardiaceae bacterium]